MKSRVTRDALGEVAMRILEDMAFLFADLAPSASPRQEVALEATLSYSGPEQGELRMSASPELAARLAENMLGVERDDPEVAERAGDALGEILNVVAGALMAHVFGTGVVCDLGVPHVSRTRAVDPPPASCAVVLVCDEDQRMELEVFTEPR